MNVKKIILPLVLLVLVNLHSYPAEVQKTKNVLVLCAMAPSTPAYRVMIDGIRNRLNASYGDAFNLHTEYLERERFKNGFYPKENFETYNDKYRDIDLDLLICIGINLVPIVKAFAEDYLLDLPTVSIDYDFSEAGIAPDYYLNGKTVVIPVKINASRTISTALGLFPGAQTLYLVSGISNSDS